MANAAHSYYNNSSLNLQNGQLELKQTEENFQNKQINGRSVSPFITEDKLKEISNKISMLYDEFQEQIPENSEEMSFNIVTETSKDSSSKTFFFIHQAFEKTGVSYISENQFEKDIKHLDENIEKLVSFKSFDEIDEKQIEKICSDFIDQAFDEGKIYKQGPNGEKLLLTEADKELLKQEFKSIFKEYIANYLLTLQEQKQTSNQNQTEESKSKVHIAVVLNTRHPETIIEVKLPNILVVEVLAKSIIQNIIKNIAAKSEQIRMEEKKEQMLLDLIDRIKQGTLKKEILNREIVKSDVNLQEIKDRINKYTEAPIEDLMKISEAYGKVEKGKNLNGGKMRLRLPGLHKMKSVSAA